MRGEAGRRGEAGGRGAGAGVRLGEGGRLGVGRGWREGVWGRGEAWEARRWPLTVWSADWLLH